MRERDAMFGGWTASGLRMRFKPTSRISQSLLTIAPWVDVVLSGLLCVGISLALTVTPGTPVELPQGPFVEGVRHAMPLVLMMAESGDETEYLVFFDDARYRLGVSEQEAALSAAIAKRVRRDGQAEAVLNADARVPHGIVMRVSNVARSAGVRKVNVAVRPE